MKRDKRVTYRAGVIPFVIKNGEPLMMFMQPSDPKYGGDKFQIAKGKIDGDETPIQAALREGREELGLFSGNVKRMVGLGGMMLGRTHFFVAEIENEDLFGDPLNETKAVAWMTNRQFQSEGRELHRPVVAAAVRVIANMVDK
jgi:8-oxo-dGTP pyrophosphatase MutT (NUDIX family)